jgi:hypothetical protein
LIIKPDPGVIIEQNGKNAMTGSENHGGTRQRKHEFERRLADGTITYTQLQEELGRHFNLAMTDEEAIRMHENLFGNGYTLSDAFVTSSYSKRVNKKMIEDFLK